MDRIRSRCGSLDDLSREMTMKHEHIVPLSRQAVAILRLAHAITGKVFSCRRDEPISDMTLNRRLKALGYDTSGEHTAHGFRTTFSTLLNGECDRDGRKTWDGDLIELQLAHLDDSSVKAIYNRTGPMSLIIARAKMMQHWADRIDTMRDGSGGKKVEPFRTSRVDITGTLRRRPRASARRLAASGSAHASGASAACTVSSL
jgi:integrase